MSDHLPRASQEPVRDYSFTHSDVSFSLPSSVFLASIAGVCVWLHPAAMILTAGGNTFCLLSFVFPPSFKPDLLPLEWPLQAPASGWKGGVNGFLFLLPSRPFPSHPVPSLLSALLHGSLGWDRQRGRVFLMPSAWKGLWQDFAWFLVQTEAKLKAGKNKRKNPQSPARCCCHKQVQWTTKTPMYLEKSKKQWGSHQLPWGEI